MDFILCISNIIPGLPGAGYIIEKTFIFYVKKKHANVTYDEACFLYYALRICSFVLVQSMACRAKNFNVFVHIHLLKFFSRWT